VREAVGSVRSKRAGEHAHHEVLVVADRAEDALVQHVPLHILCAQSVFRHRASDPEAGRPSSVRTCDKCILHPPTRTSTMLEWPLKMFAAASLRSCGVPFTSHMQIVCSSR
jgi:hypothetical protein